MKIEKEKQHGERLFYYLAGCILMFLTCLFGYLAFEEHDVISAFLCGYTAFALIASGILACFCDATDKT